MNKNTMMVATVIIVIMVFLCIFAYGIITRPVPQQTLEQVASTYLNAVQQQDLWTLNQLCFPENNDCSIEMPDRLKIYAGLKLHDIHISYRDTPSSYYWVVRIRAKGTNDKHQTVDINDSISLRKRDEAPELSKFLQDRRWYITGSPKNPHPLPGAPASITTPTPSAYPDPRSYSPQSYPEPSP